MFKKQKEEKNKVGRPKLADSKLKKESIIVSCIVIFTAILLTIFGGMELVSMAGENSINADSKKSSFSFNKLKGIGFSALNSSVRWYSCNTYNAYVTIPFTVNCHNGYRIASITDADGHSLTRNGDTSTDCSKKLTHYYNYPIKYIKVTNKHSGYPDATKFKLTVTNGKTTKTTTETLSWKADRYKSCIKVTTTKKTSATKTTSTKECKNTIKITGLDDKKVNTKFTLGIEGSYSCASGRYGFSIISNSAGCKSQSGSNNRSLILKCSKTGSVTVKFTDNGTKLREGTVKIKSGVITTTTKKKTTTKKTTTKKNTTCKLKSSSVKEKTASLIFECSESKPSITSKKVSNGGKISSASVSGKKVTVKLSNLKAKQSYTVSFKANGTTSSGKVTTASGCDITLSSRKATSVNYKLACGYNTKVTSQTITYSDGSKVTGPKFGTKLTNKESKSFSSSITGLNATKKYKLTVKTTDGTYTKSFYPMDEEALKSLTYGKCPVAPSITGVISSGTTYDTEKVNMSVNINSLSTAEKSNLYVVTKSYNADRVLSYNIAGKSKTEKIGAYNDAVVRPLTGVWNTKDKTTYTKQINTGNLYYVAIYSGSHKCSTNYIVKDGYTLNNHGRKYPLSSYNIVTKKGVVRGRQSGTKVTSTDEKVFKVNPNLTENSLKATSQTAKNGSESSKTATITMSNTLGTGSFKIRLVNRYWETAYLLNPLTKKTNGALTSSNMYSGKYNVYAKAKTKDSKGNTVYGTELKTGSSKSVYAMDSGTVSSVRTSIPKNTKDTYKLYVQITSTVNEEKYIHTYANLKSVSVKKGDRVYKGQIIGKTNTNYLYISFNYVNRSSLIGMLPSNFIGKNVSYAGINSKSKATNCQTYGTKCTSGLSTPTTTKTSTSSSKPKTDPTTKATSKEEVTVPQGTCKIEYANRKVGDVDCDGYAKASDALAILHNSTKKVEILKVSRYGLSNQTQLLEIANLDNDDEVKASDALSILRFATNKTNKICNKNNKCNTK